MEAKKKKLVIGLIIAALVIGAGVYWWKTSQKKKIALKKIKEVIDEPQVEDAPAETKDEAPAPAPEAASPTPSRGELIQRAIAKIESNDKLKDSLAQKAERNGRSYEEQLQISAEKAVDNAPAK